MHRLFVLKWCQATKAAKSSESAVPKGKVRVLPDWMVGAADRSGIAEPPSKTSTSKGGGRRGRPAKQAATGTKGTPKAKGDHSLFN